tara:strand:- start:71 stop:490 length:420 start_codon:yes stop_codon:yes gene_type:complete
MKSEFLLGIDYGTRKIGVSIGQIITKSSRPLRIIYKDRINELKKIITEWNIEKMIIGYPVHDKVSPIHKEIEKFSDEIKSSVDFNMEVIFHNEVFTSEFARNDFANMRKKGITKKSSSDYDDISASIILQSWINENMID